MNTDRRGRVIEAVLFDADGVVQTTAEGWRNALGGLCGDPSRTETFLQAVFDAERPALTGHSNFESSLAAVLESWECAAGVEDALRVWEMIEPSEAVLSIVDRLRTSGTRVGLATNQQTVRARFMTQELGYAARFDDLFYSCHLGAAKPEPPGCCSSMIIPVMWKLPGRSACIRRSTISGRVPMACSHCWATTGWQWVGADFVNHGSVCGSRKTNRDAGMKCLLSGIDHIYLSVTDFQRSEAFYDLVMEALGTKKGDKAIGGEPHAHYFGPAFQVSIRPARHDESFDAYRAGLHHLCFQTDSTDTVDECHRILTGLGVRATVPAHYPEYHPEYYATFFEDPDGIRLEIVNRTGGRDRIAQRWSELDQFLNPLQALDAREP
jgi:catechol 2,3-dioxygenase-like lactoylglutathione lyase family enzyme